MKKFHQSEGHSCIPPKGNISKPIPGVSKSELKQCGRFISHTIRSQRWLENEQGKFGKYISTYMVQKLKDLQFEYKVVSNNDSRQYSRLVRGLVQFKKDNGHCNFTAIYKMPDIVPELLKLYEWAHNNKRKLSKTWLEICMRHLIIKHESCIRIWVCYYIRILLPLLWPWPPWLSLSLLSQTPLPSPLFLPLWLLKLSDKDSFSCNIVTSWSDISWRWIIKKTSDLLVCDWITASMKLCIGETQGIICSAITSRLINCWLLCRDH